MMSSASNEEKIQYLADILSLTAVVGRLNAAAMQQVLASLGSELTNIEPLKPVDPKLAARLVAEIASHAGENVAAEVTNDLAFVASAWRPVLDEYGPIAPYRQLPYAEIIYALVNHTGKALSDRNVLQQFGGIDLLLPMPQLTAALKIYATPVTNLKWEIIGFVEPSDQALFGSDAEMMYLFKSAFSGDTLRFSELERQSDSPPRSEHDVLVDKSLFAAFIAGLAGDLLYYAAKLRVQTASGHDVWQRLLVLLGGEPDGQ